MLNLLFSFAIVGFIATIVAITKPYPPLDNPPNYICIIPDEDKDKPCRVQMLEEVYVENQLELHSSRN
jgi:hypothetical protein